MRTLVVDAPLVVVRTVAEHLREARVAKGPDGKVRVQSPDFDGLDASEMQSIAEGLTAAGLSAVVLEAQDPLPEVER